MGEKVYQNCEFRIANCEVFKAAHFINSKFAIRNSQFLPDNPAAADNFVAAVED
jgi:hypothetical protein